MEERGDARERATRARVNTLTHAQTYTHFRIRFADTHARAGSGLRSRSAAEGPAREEGGEERQAVAVEERLPSRGKRPSTRAVGAVRETGDRKEEERDGQLAPWSPRIRKAEERKENRRAGGERRPNGK